MRAPAFTARQPTPVGGSAASRVALISVVVCTTGRRPTLAALLRSLAELDDPAYEVIVVENSRSPRLSSAQLAGFGARHVVVARVGLDVARNRGCAAASGDVVAFVDDDCEVDPGWLSGLRLAFADPDVALVTGRVLPASVALPSEHAFQAAFPWDRGIEPLRFSRAERRGWFPVSMHELGTGCNMAFRRGALESIGGFDEALDMGTFVGGGGDMDAFARLIDAGVAAAYEPTALLWHRHRGTMKDLRWQVWGYGLAQGAVMAKAVMTRRSLRRAALGFWWSRLWRRLRDLAARLWSGTGLPRSVLALEAAGMVVGPIVYLLSLLQSRWRRVRE